MTHLQLPHPLPHHDLPTPAHAFNFTDYDIKLNRDGKMSMRQRGLLFVSWLFSAFWTSVYIAVFTLLPFTVLSIPSSWIPRTFFYFYVIIVVTILIVPVLIRLWDTLRDILGNSVDTITTMPKFDAHVKNAKIVPHKSIFERVSLFKYELKLKKEIFRITRDQQDSVPRGIVYSFYVTKHTRQILSLETPADARSAHSYAETLAHMRKHQQNNWRDDLRNL